MLKKTLPGWLILLLLLAAVHLTRAEGLPTPTPARPGSDPEPVIFSLVIHADGTWDGEALFSHASPLRAQQEAAAIFGNHGVRYNLGEKEGDSYTFSLAGDDARAIVELALSAGHTVKRFDGPVALDMGGFVSAGQAVTLTLTANPSTGYSWRMEPQAGSALSQVNGVEMHQVAQGLGTLARQIVRLRAAETGQTDFRLLYQRPWQSDLAPTVVISVQAAGLSLAETCAAISAPPPPSAPIDTLGIQAGAPQQPASLSSVQTLPSAYNWCDSNGGCTSIKDQALCGGCWAFATIGPLEAHLQAEGQTTDLAEQYLISCNIDGWGCDGGWFAHDSHEWKIPPSEPAAGTVLESAFPYVASDTACAGPYTHPHKIADWSYVGNGNSIPSTNAIKQAIQNHGPVAVAICVDTLFQKYTGGVFQTDESGKCNRDVNHAVVLVGWNDSDQTWILRNSWGTDWGESGYMRIRYGISNVGFAANYVVYTPTTPFVATDWVYLPLVLRNFGTAPGASLLNGDFENGPDGSWTESSSNGWQLILDSSQLTPHGGNWAAWLGGDYYESSILSQEVTIPSNATTLNYWYGINSKDLCGYDHAYVYFGTNVLKSYDLCASNNTNGWTSQQVNVTSWQGKTVDLRFAVETDGSLNSNFFLDDVSISPTTGSPAVSISPNTPESAAGDTAIPQESR